MGQFNVGGGLLAAAGALGGLGQGLTAVGQEQQKMNMAEKMNQLAQAREEAITRLQQSGQQLLEGQRETHEDKTLASQQGFEGDLKDRELKAGGAIANAKISSAEEQNRLHRESQERIAKGHDAAKIGAAKAAHPPGAGKPPKPEFDVKDLPGGVDVSTGKQIMPKRLIKASDGTSWVSRNGYIYPFEQSADDGIGKDESAFAHAPTPETQKLLKAPLAILPSGTSARDSYVQRWGRLPVSYQNAANIARQQQWQANQSGQAGATSGDTDTEDPAESEADPAPVE